MELQPWPGRPPITNGSTDLIPIASSTVNIPQGHDGRLMILAKTRVQAGDTPGYPGDHGLVFLGISIDGVPQGSTGVQQISFGASNSQRTLAASFVSTAANHLSPGPHVIQVWVKASGSFVHLAAFRDLPMLYFDQPPPAWV